MAEILGYLGPNGSGKSTTVNIVVGLARAECRNRSRSTAEQLSEDPSGYKRRIGYVPEEPYLYTHLTSTEYLTLVARLRRIPASGNRRGRSQSCCDCFSCTTADTARCARFSKGMRQRVLLAAALLHNPDLLVLDEPFSGLDVNAGLLFRALLALLAARRPDDSLQHAPLRHGREAVLARRDSVEWAQGRRSTW